MDNRPSFIIIHTDQQRWDCAPSVHKRKGLFTPNLDSIANRGVNFTSAYSTCPVCCPQRMTMMTGQLARTHGMLANSQIPYFPFEHSMPQEFNKAGYKTAMVGRNMHLYPSLHNYEFSYYCVGDPSTEDVIGDNFFKNIAENTPNGEGGYYGNGTTNNSYLGIPFHLPDEFHHTKWTTNSALDFLDRHDGNTPYLLMVGYYSPHAPLNPPENLFNRYYDKEDLDQPAIGDWEIPPISNTDVDVNLYVNLDGELLRNARAGYYGNITFIDYQIGRILQKVKNKNVYVIYTSDHGEMLGDHYFYHKTKPFEGACHIPMLMMGPNIKPNQKCDKVVGWHDILPSILDLANAEIPNCVDGESFVPLVKDTEKTAKWREFIHGECVYKREHHCYEGQVTENNVAFEEGSHYLTDGKMKYIWHITTGRELLFNLEEDYQELVDLACKEEYKEELAMWRARLVKTLKDSPEGFSDGEKLITGILPVGLLPNCEAIAQQRYNEGYKVDYYESNERLRPRK